MKIFLRRIKKDKQKGMVLLVTLVMIALMSIVAISAIRGSNLQEAMAGNFHDRSIAFQSAEAGLRVAESFIAANGGTANFNDSGGLYTDQSLSTATIGNVTKWTDTQWNANSKAVTSTNVDLGVSKYPQYVIEKLLSDTVSGTTSESVEFGDEAEVGTAATYFRITSRGFGNTGNSEVVLQSTFKAIF